MTDVVSPYSTKFFTANARSSTPSAEQVLKIVYDLIKVDSIVDIGCGSGAWLSVAEQLGSTVLRGYDGPWADPAKFTSPNIDFVPVDLENEDFEHDRRYDLAMSVEVAEHLSDSRSDFIVDRLCAASDIVLFGAAITGQGGTHHINEQPQTYWIEKFRSRGYEPFDVIRPALWENETVKYWFVQNTFLFVKTGSDAVDRDALAQLQGAIYDTVHPRLYEAKIRNLRKRERARGEKTSTELAEARKRIQGLEKQLAGSRPAKRPLLKTRAKDIPAPLRPVLTRAWHALPPKTRKAIRRAGR